MSIKVYEKDKIFQRATVAGWRPMQGTQINIQGIDFAFCPSKKNKDVTIDVFEIESGTLMVSVAIDIIALFGSSTRDKAIELYKKEIATAVVSKINKFGIKKVKSEIERMEKQMTSIFGERPEIVDLEEENN